MKSQGSPYSVAEENNGGDSTAILDFITFNVRNTTKNSLGFKIVLFVRFGL